jgi:sugar-specific transcriptional regulator TrmB
MQSDIQNLINIGLSEKEAIIYLTLATVGKSSAYKLAQKSKVKLPTVYINIETLIQKGLIIRIPNVNKQIFIHQSLENYLDKIGNSINYSRNLDNKLKKKIQTKIPVQNISKAFLVSKRQLIIDLKNLKKKMSSGTFMVV